jgi:hypothetical protein
MGEKKNKDGLTKASKSDPKVDSAVLWLQQHKNQMEQELTLFAKQVGSYLLKEFFDDDPEKVASQNPTKNISFRRLCERADLPFSESSLRRFIQVAINFQILPAAQAQKLLPSHHSVLYQVADPDERKRLGEQAAKEGVSVRALRKMVKGKGKRRPGGGRKPDTEFAKGWRQLLGLLENLNTEAERQDFLNFCGIDNPEADCERIRKLMGKIINKMDPPPTDKLK